MARPVKMTVNNNTGKVLKLDGKNAKHGKFTDAPTPVIESTGFWKCTTRTGGKVGPEGTVTYKDKDEKFTVEFYYNHPFSSATSSYRITVTPSDAIGYDIKGSFEGHDQDITFELYNI